MTFFLLLSCCCNAHFFTNQSPSNRNFWYISKIYAWISNDIFVHSIVSNEHKIFYEGQAMMITFGDVFREVSWCFLDQNWMTFFLKFELITVIWLSWFLVQYITRLYPWNRLYLTDSKPQPTKHKPICYQLCTL